MNKFILLNGIFIFYFFLYFTTCAQDTIPNNTTAYIKFNVGNSTLKHKKHQKVTMFGCNTVVAIDSASPKNFDGLSWNKADQVVPGIPYGRHFDKRTKKQYYVSQYFVASPPVFEMDSSNKHKKNTVYDIGIVTPDNFSLIGDKPVQQIFMDYDVLKLMYIEYFPIEFDTTFNHTIDSLVPFTVECKDFPWLDSKTLHGAKGASGIGYLTNNPDHKGRLFLPYYYENKTPTDSAKFYLDCEVTILNDILLNYEVFFKVDNVLYTSINLKDFKDRTRKLQFTRRYRKGIPCGCRKPEPSKEYDKVYQKKQGLKNSQSTFKK